MTGEFTIAVHALVFLNHKGCALSSAALAENVCTNPARIRKVMAKLAHSGLIHAKEGAEGGYSFDLDAKSTDLLSVANALGESVVPPFWKSGNPDMECLVASGMGNVMDGICSDLDELCRQRLSHITIDDIDKKIFVK